MADVTPTQGRYLAYIHAYTEGFGLPPAESEPGIKCSRCIDGERACPPEDVGGVYGFADYVEAITNPSHSEHDDYLEWYGPFDPTEFDAEKATRRMRKGLPTW